MGLGIKTLFLSVKLVKLGKRPLVSSKIIILCLNGVVSWFYQIVEKKIGKKKMKKATKIQLKDTKLNNECK